MGQVYAGYDETLERTVALKVLHSHGGNTYTFTCDAPAGTASWTYTIRAKNTGFEGVARIDPEINNTPPGPGHA
jgi:hypothetical protein